MLLRARSPAWHLFRKEFADFAIARREQLPCFRKALLDFRQPVENGLLKNAPGILVLVDAHFLVRNRLGQLLDFCIPPIDLDALARSRHIGGLHLRLELVKLHREFRPHAILVGTNFRLRQRQRAFQRFRREPLYAVTIGGKQHDHDQGRDQEAERHEHRGVKGDQSTGPDLMGYAAPAARNVPRLADKPTFSIFRNSDPRSSSAIPSKWVPGRVSSIFRIAYVGTKPQTDACTNGSECDMPGFLQLNADAADEIGCSLHPTKSVVNV